MRTLKTILLMALAAALLLVTAGCSDDSPAPTTAQAASPQPACAPVQVSVAIDKTGSANHNRTPQPQAADFDPLYETLMGCGGELAVVLLGSRDNGPLLRLRIEPPTPPAAPADPNQNPLDYDDQRRQSQERRAKAEALNRARDTDATARIQTFDTSLDALLAHPADAHCSDIVAGLRRLARFHNEPATLWGNRKLHKWSLVASDGEHNCGSRQLDPLPGVQVLAVNGAPGLGILKELNPTPLESFEAAVKLIAAAAEPPPASQQEPNQPQKE